jgi:hypothetical protein
MILQRIKSLLTCKTTLPFAGEDAQANHAAGSRPAEG